MERHVAHRPEHVEGGPAALLRMAARIQRLPRDIERLVIECNDVRPLARPERPEDRRREELDPVGDVPTVYRI